MTIFRKVAYGKRAEARNLVPFIKQPAERAVPLMWLAAGALSDGKKGEALADLKKALKWGGAAAAQHEWLGLLLARAGDNVTATQIFNQRQKALEAVQGNEADIRESNEMSSEGWGSLCAALLRAGRTPQALMLLKKHPEAYSTVLGNVFFAKDSPQKRAVLKVIAGLPVAMQQTETSQLLALLPLGAKADSKLVKSHVESVERYSRAQIASWHSKQSEDEEDEQEEANSEQLIALCGKVVAAWQWIGEPARAKAFLARPDLKLNESQRALIESNALSNTAYFRAFLNGNHEARTPELKLPLTQSQLLCHQMVANFRRLRYNEARLTSFSELTSQSLEFFQQIGDRASARAIAKSSEQVLERNWRFANQADTQFQSLFINQAKLFAKIGELASAKKWMERYRQLTPKFNELFWLDVYQDAGLMREARAVIDATPKLPVDAANSETAMRQSYWDLGFARDIAFAETSFAQNARSSAERNVALDFPQWAGKLPIEARAQLLPEYALSLSSRDSSPMFNIRDSGAWEIGG